MASSPSTTARLDGADGRDLDRAAALLRRGELVALPTETVYGLGGLGLAPLVVERIFAAKGRPSDNPVILHVPSLEAALPLWRQEPSDEPALARARALADAFWPGPLTIVAVASEVVPPAVRAGLPKVAVRVPRHPAFRGVLERLGEPLAAPSANASGRPSPTRADDVLATLEGRIAAVVDGGPCGVGIESTVVDVTGPHVTVLRPGAIGEAEVRAVVGEVAVRAEGSAAHKGDASPGLRHRHYAPAVGEVVLVGAEEELRRAWSSEAALLVRAATHARLAAAGARPAGALSEVLPDDAAGFARELYAALYRVERAQPKRLVMERPPDDDTWRPVRDRLLRAASRHG